MDALLTAPNGWQQLLKINGRPSTILYRCKPGAEKFRDLRGAVAAGDDTAPHHVFSFDCMDGETAVYRLTD